MTRFDRIKEAVKADDPKDIARMLCDLHSGCEECMASKLGYGCRPGNNAYLRLLNSPDDDEGA